MSFLTNVSRLWKSPRSESTIPPTARLCHLVQWPGYKGFGMSYYSEEVQVNEIGATTVYQYTVGKVSPNSPAQLAGIREGDRIVEINFVNIRKDDSVKVSQRFNRSNGEVTLLVVDKFAQDYFDKKQITVSSSMTELTCYRTPLVKPKLSNVQPISVPRDYIVPITRR